MRRASRLLVGTVLTVLVTGFTPAAIASAPPNYQGLWWNSPPGSESGWGLNLAHQGDTIFATWFTYDATGEGWWLSMTANRTADGTYAGSLVETTGPAFHEMPFDPARVTRTAVGSGTLAFRDADNGTFGYTVGGVAQTKSITRFLFGSPVACTFGAAPNFAAATNYQDLWWAAGGAESGWGINLAHQGDTIFATWFTYDADGTPLWLSATAARLGPRVFSGPLIRTTGPAFGPGPFDPARVTRATVGTASLAFRNGNAGAFTYTVDGTTRTRAITRLLFEPPAGTRCGAPAASPFHGKVFDGLVEGAIVCADANGNGRCDPDEARTLSDAAGAYELAVPDGFDGTLVAEVVAGQSRDRDRAGMPVDRSYRLASPGREYGANITPYTTLVRLAGERDFRLAEDIVRAQLGLPPGFDINPAKPPADGSLARAVARSIVAALKSAPETLDFSSRDALARVVAALPGELTELPRLHIDTYGVPIASRENYIDATFRLTNPAASVPRFELGGRIRGRGNTTWLEAKKPYKIQFNKDAGYAKIPDILGMRKNRNWALLADYLDRSLIRNKLAFTLGASSVFADGLKWSPSGQHVEVYHNDAYLGVYLLTEDIRIDSARLPLREMSTSPGDGEVDGGFIAEVDYPQDCYYSPDLNLQHQTPVGVRLCVDTPDEEDVTPAQLAYIKGYLDAAEGDIYGSGSLARINAASFADWYLLNELFRNEDAVFYSSVFLWKDTDAAAIPADRVLNMGPIWDFDIAAGNIAHYENWMTEGCWLTKGLDWVPNWPNWYRKLFDSPEFLHLTLARWQEKRPALERLVNAGIDAFARRLQEPQARNFARWPVLGTPSWNRHYVFGTHAEEAGFVRHFLNERMQWLDRAFASPEAFARLCR